MSYIIRVDNGKETQFLQDIADVHRGDLKPWMRWVPVYNDVTARFPEVMYWEVIIPKRAARRLHAADVERRYRND